MAVWESSWLRVWHGSRPALACETMSTSSLVRISITSHAPSPEESTPSSEIWYWVTGPHTHSTRVSSAFMMCWYMYLRRELNMYDAQPRSMRGNG